MTVRVAHIFGRMGIGGAETWLMNLYRRLDTTRVHFDFLVHRDEPGEYDDEIRALGGRITRIGVSYRSPAYGPPCMNDDNHAPKHTCDNAKCDRANLIPRSLPGNNGTNGINPGGHKIN